MIVESPVFKNGESLPSLYTCDGRSINPPFVISGVPEGTKSLVLIMEDPDTARGIFVHWVVWNIPASTTRIDENSIPQGAQEGITGAGTTGYRGPCPPSGIHRYFFKFYALDTKLTLFSDTDASVLDKEIQGHILDQYYLMGIYSRQSK
jgi:Raf kinase inhibitor-like YbhB/YbcL family protein